MQSRRSLLLSLVCATVFACAVPAIADASQQNAPPPSKQGAPQPAAGNATEVDAQRAIPAAYRLTYTLTEMDGEKRLGSQHYAMALDPDTKTTLRLGTKVPIITGQFSGNSSNEISYIDIGLRIDARLRQFANGLELETRVIQSSLDSQEPNSKDPVIRQTDLDTSVLLNEDKPVVLGTLDTPGSTHRLTVQAELTRLH